MTNDNVAHHIDTTPGPNSPPKHQLYQIQRWIQLQIPSLDSLLFIRKQASFYTILSLFFFFFLANSVPALYFTNQPLAISFPSRCCLFPLIHAVVDFPSHLAPFPFVLLFWIWPTYNYYNTIEAIRSFCIKLEASLFCLFVAFLSFPHFAILLRY